MALRLVWRTKGLAARSTNLNSDYETYLTRKAIVGFEFPRYPHHMVVNIGEIEWQNAKVLAAKERLWSA